jgi:hypothetical protein
VRVVNPGNGRAVGVGVFSTVGVGVLTGDTGVAASKDGKGVVVSSTRSHPVIKMGKISMMMPQMRVFIYSYSY